MLLPLLPPSVLTSKRHTLPLIPLPDIFCTALWFHYRARGLFCYTVCSNHVKSETRIWKIKTSLPRFHGVDAVMWAVMRSSLTVLKVSKHFYHTDLWLKQFITMQVQFHLYTLEGVFVRPQASLYIYFWVPQRFSLWFYRLKQHHAVLDMLRQICFIFCIHPTMD